MGGYQIIKFIEENTVEVVPSAWLTQEGEQQICLWPNTPSLSLISTAIKSQQSPKDDWKKFVVKQLNKNVYDSFATATAKATKATYSSCLESESEGILGVKDTEPKRSRKRNKRFISSSDDEDSPPKRSPPTRKISVSRSPLSYPTPPKVQRTNSQNLICSQAILNVRSKLEEKMVTLGNNNSQNKKCSSCVKHEELFTQVIRLLHIINGRVGQNSELLTTVLNAIQSGGVVIPENETPDLDIPARSYEDLMNLEKKLEDSKVKECLLKELVHIGGHNVKEIIKRIIPRLVSDEVLKQFSWIGGKGKKIFSQLQVSALIKDVCKQSRDTKTVTEKVVEEAVAVFLTKATERCNRRMIKENKTTSNETEDQ